MLVLSLFADRPVGALRAGLVPPKRSVTLGLLAFRLTPPISPGDLVHWTGASHLEVMTLVGSGSLASPCLQALSVDRMGNVCMNIMSKCIGAYL